MMSINSDLWTASASGADNRTGISPSFAPMKIKSLRSVVLENKQRVVVGLVFVCLALFALVPGAAQLRNQKRMISLQLGESAEGAQVSIVSDAALNDYEAFRRGERFYVKIPLADFTSLPHLRADGFEEVQVQRVGDDLIVSFKLQPGATARVEPGSNRLNVLFSSPNRVLRNNAANSGSNGAGPTAGRPRSVQDRHDAAGPMPPGSELALRLRIVVKPAPDGNEGRSPRNTRTPTAPQSNSNKTANGRPTGANTAAKTPTPFPSPKSVLTPATSTTYTPSATTSPFASASVKPASASSGSLNWDARSRAARKWISANRLATLLGALILLSLILYLVMALRRRRQGAMKVKRASVPKVQPNPSSDADFAEVTRSSPVAAAPSAAAATQNREQVLTRPSITSPSVVHDEHSAEEEEREVFEL